MLNLERSAVESRRTLSQLWKKAALSKYPIELMLQARGNQATDARNDDSRRKSSGGGIRTPDTRIMIPLL